MNAYTSQRIPKTFRTTLAAGTLCVAALALLVSAPVASAQDRPDQPPWGGLTIGSLAGLEALPYAALSRDAIPYVSSQVNYVVTAICLVDAATETFLAASIYNPDLIKSGKRKTKVSQKAWGFVTAVSDDGVGGAFGVIGAVESCKISASVTDSDKDGAYGGGTDTLDISMKCGPTTAADLGLDEAGQALFLERIGKKPSCHVTGVPTLGPPVVGGCFRGDTVVATETGPRPIRELAEGDKVWSFDEASGKDVLRPVTKTYRRLSNTLRELRVGEETLHITDEHPLRVAGKGWTAAADLALGDEIALADGAVAKVASSRRVDRVAFFAGYEPVRSRAKADAEDAVRPVSLSEPPTMKAPTLDGPLMPMVFNIEVGDTHNFYVGKSRVLVHNK